MSRALAGLAAGIFLVGLAGCSGGGGGGGGGGAVGGGGDTPLTYTGNTNPATLTATNAGSITANVVGSGDVSQAVSIAAVAPESGTIDVGRALQRSVRKIVAKPGTRRSTSAIPFDDDFACDTGSFLLSGTLADNGTGTLQVKYNACQTGEVIATGSGSVRVDAFDFSLDIPSDFTVTLARLTLSGSVAGEVSGTLRTRFDLATSSITTTENLIARFGSGTMTKSENLMYVDVINATGFTESVSGRVFHSVHGFVDISTTVPLVFATLTQEFPNTGMLLLTGASGTAVRVTALSPTQLNLAVDADGNGTFETAVLLAWSDLSGPVAANLGDDDRDGMHNGWEIAHNLNPKDPSDALADPDNDGATNLMEYQAGTDPRNRDSVPPAVGLSIQAGDAPDPVVVGVPLTYTLAVSNSTSVAASNVVVVDTLPALVSLVSASANQGTCAGTAPVTCNLGTVNGNTMVTVTIVVRPTATGVITNTATVSTSSFEPAIFDNTATAATTVTPPAPSPTDLQLLIDAATTGNTIIVEPGIYRGPLDFKSKNLVLRSRHGPAATIISGNGGAGTAGNVPVISMGPGGTLTGFTITGGQAAFGAGVGLNFSSGALISGNIFDGNSQGAGGFGAAIGGNGASATIERNIFRNNTCDNQFNAGVVSFVNASAPRIVDNLFVNNLCRAISLSLPEGNAPQVINNTIVGNRTGIEVHCFQLQATQTYRNNILVNNGIGLNLECSPADSPVWANNLVFGNTNGSTTTDYVGIADPTGTNGNIRADPLFVNQAAGNYDLSPGSPAINAGSDAGAPTVDFDGVLRVSPVDIGAFEGP